MQPLTAAAGSADGLLRSIAETFAAKVGAAALGLISGAIVARALGPEGRGAFVAAATLSGLGVQLANVGLQTANTCYVSRDASRLPTVIANSLLVACLAGAAAAAAVLVCAWLLGATVSLPAGLIWLAMVSIPIGLAYMLFSQLLIAVERVQLFNQIEIGSKSASIILSIAIVLIGIANPSALFFCAVAAQTAGLWVLWKSLGQRVTVLRSGSLALLREQLPLGMRAYLAALLASLLLRSDVLLVQSISGNAETGYYSIAVAMADVLYMLPAAAGMLLFPRMTAMRDAKSRRGEAMRMLLLIGAAMTGLGAAAAIAATPVVTLVFGVSFEPAVSMFYILVVAMVIYGMNNIVSVLLASEGMPWIAVWVWGVGLVVNIALNLFLIPTYGGHGAAFASLISYGLVLIIQLFAVLAE
jgi:O-antigen/teichoic acid export membrane protein